MKDKKVQDSFGKPQGKHSITYTEEQIEQLSELTGLLLQTTDLRNVLNFISKAACDIIDADASSIMLYDKDRSAYVIKAYYNLSQAYTKVVKAQTARDVARQSIDLHDPVIISDIPRHFEEIDDNFSLNWIKKEKLVSMICVPIIFNDRAYGALNIYFRKHHGFSRIEKSLITMFAKYSGIAINNANLVSDRDSRIKELTAINKISFGISGELDMDSLLELIYLECCQIMDTTNFYIALFNSETNMVRFPLYFEEGKPINPKERELSNGLTDYIIKEKTSLRLNKFSPEQRKQLGVEGVGKKSRSWLGVPVISKDEVLGVIAVQNFENENVYDEDDENVLNTIANQAAVAIKTAMLYEEMRVLSNTDGLTGLFNSRYFWDNLPLEVERANRYNRELSLVIFDLDNFKEYNDNYGHQVGDFLLKKVADIIKNTARQSDCCARYGGEEFVVILPETGVPGAFNFAERVRENIENTTFTYQYDKIRVKLTISGGISTHSEKVNTSHDLVKQADLALYKAKSLGKNKIIKPEEA